jgi:hypothetical protein
MLQVLTPEPESLEGSTSESAAESNPKRNFRPPQGENLSEDSMKKALLLIVALILLVALAFAQTPASINTDQTNIKGCLGGSEGNYTVRQNNTGHIFKIATSSVDLKPHVGHDVTLIGNRASGESSSAADNSLDVTTLTMISEHCAEAAAAPAATVSTLSETAITPPEAAAAPAATTSTVETAVTPAEAATAPAATTGPVAETVVTPPAAVTPPSVATPPVETVVTPSERVSTPAAGPRRLPAAPAAATAKPDVTANSASETISPPAATATPIATPSAAWEPVTTPAAVAATPTAPARHGSLWLLTSFAVLVIVLGVLAPTISRWRKRKSLDRTDAPNLSFTREASSDQGKSDAQGPRKAA